MTCAACTHAKTDPSCILGDHRCMGCKARAVANLGFHVESEEFQAITPKYRETLERLFGDGWKAGNELVKEWAGRIRASAANSKTTAGGRA